MQHRHRRKAPQPLEYLLRATYNFYAHERRPATPSVGSGIQVTWKRPRSSSQPVASTLIELLAYGPRKVTSEPQDCTGVRSAQKDRLVFMSFHQSTEVLISCNRESSQLSKFLSTTDQKAHTDERQEPRHCWDCRLEREVLKGRQVTETSHSQVN